MGFHEVTTVVENDYLRCKAAGVGYSQKRRF